MAGFVIHSIIGEQYLLKHKSDEENHDEFIKGNYLPDLTYDKQTTHYGKSPAYTGLKAFLLVNPINTSLNRGIFLHLIADYLFYNKYLRKFEKKVLHNDYDLTNHYLIEKYKIVLNEEIKKYVFYKEGTPVVLTYELLDKFIDEVSSLNLEQTKEEVLAGKEKWSKYKKLV